METEPIICDPAKISSIRKMLRGARIGPRNEALFVLGINTAFRISELLSLRVKDVFKGGKVREEIVMREKKTGKTRRCPLNAVVQSALKDYLEQREKEGASSPGSAAFFVPEMKQQNALQAKSARHFVDLRKRGGLAENRGSLHEKNFRLPRLQADWRKHSRGSKTFKP
jgi:integrase